jgi:hypothetical protein
MLSNAVSSAVDRLYAGSAPVQEKPRIDRVAAVVQVQRLRAVSDADGGAPAAPQDDRGDAFKRQTLTKGVQAAFEAVLAGDRPVTSATPENTAEPGERNTRAEDATPDPQLEEAIMRFIHTMFRSLAETEGPIAGASAAAGGGRDRLSARIEALAKRLAEPSESGEQSPGVVSLFGELTGGPERTGAQKALDQAFAEVVQALGGNLGGGEANPELRANLSQLMHRLAQAMHGAPPVDPGLPTRGALLSERA